MNYELRAEERKQKNGLNKPFLFCHNGFLAFKSQKIPKSLPRIPRGAWVIHNPTFALFLGKKYNKRSAKRKNQNAKLRRFQFFRKKIETFQNFEI